MYCSAANIPSVGVGSAEEALTLVGENFAGIVISDIRLPGIDGLELLTRLKALDKSLPVVLITGHGDISMAVGAMRNGAYDFMEKPFSPERLVDVARRALEQRGLAREVWSLRRQLAERDSLEGRIIGRSPAMQNLRELIANSVAVDCRVIAATKSDLDDLSRANQFRSDLYYRLNVVTLELPPLRERREDILQLFEHFLQQSSLRFDRTAPDLDNQTLSSLMSHDWPGNVRELRNVAERFALGLPAFKKSGASSGNHGLAFTEAVEAFERNLLNDALQRSGGNLTQASQELGMAKTTLFDKERIVDLLLKAALGAGVVLILAALAKTKNYYIAGLVPLFPTFALIAHYIVGKGRSVEDLKTTIVFGMWSIIPYFVYLATLYVMVDRMRLEASLAVAAVAWLMAATILVSVWVRMHA
eukprot:gene9083-10651_t